MSLRYVITRMPFNGAHPLVCAFCDDHRLLEVQCIPEHAPVQILNNIYVARVSQVVSSINAAFVEIAKGQRCFLPLSQVKSPVYVRRMSEKRLLSQDDEILVQVIREAVKTKEPQVTTALSLAGRYCVVTSENGGLGISSKLSQEERTRLREAVAQTAEASLGVIVRTNAAQAPEDVLCSELCMLQSRMHELLTYAKGQCQYALLHEAEPEYIRLLQNQSAQLLETVVTDDADIYQKLCDYAGRYPDTGLQQKLMLYQDQQLELYKLYSLQVQLERAWQKKVWLKSGSNLVIEPTEAMTVIDVNSAKNLQKKDQASQIFSVNMEAAAEIARQLRLRNISGIIMIDFIDMKSPEDQKKLLFQMRQLVREDPVRTEVVDLTKLGLMELTRQKIRRPLHEQLNPL